MSGRHGRDGVTLAVDFFGIRAVCYGRVGCDVPRRRGDRRIELRRCAGFQALTCTDVRVIP
ncbi:hypothetical protein CXY01_36320 [Cellulomonas xylanilytica]|uniref:Uncharacterized protein n=1 Tax=Cellulomonas xylanilytica TaxID=233583 RepID=A0A510V8C7_9CELL|nr:hypothetical protein CXY01_36320 [Cellulomonas xylanilytica]